MVAVNVLNGEMGRQAITYNDQAREDKLLDALVQRPLSAVWCPNKEALALCRLLCTSKHPNALHSVPPVVLPLSELRLIDLNFDTRVTELRVVQHHLSC